MEFKFDLDTDIALTAEGSGGAYGILPTGIYSVTIMHASVGKSFDGQNNEVNIAIKTDDGHETTIWGLGIDATKANGQENYDYKKWQSLAAVTGMKTGEQAPYKLELSNGAVKDLVVFKELQGVQIKAAIQINRYMSNAGEVKEKNIFHSFYNKDGKSLSEIVGNKDATQIDKVAARLSDKIAKNMKGATTAPAETSTPTEENSADIFA